MRMPGLQQAEARIASIESRFPANRWVFEPELAPAYKAVGTLGPEAVVIPDALRTFGDGQVDAADRQAVLGTFATDASTLTAADGSWIRRLPERGQQWAGSIADAARANGLDAELVAAVAWTASGFDPAVSDADGGIGLLQLSPATVADYGVDAAEPLDTLAAGAHHLRDLVEGASDLDAALAELHSGVAEPRERWSNATLATIATIRERVEELRGVGASSAAASSSAAAPPSAVTSSSAVVSSSTTVLPAPAPPVTVVAAARDRYAAAAALTTTSTSTTAATRPTSTSARPPTERLR